MSPAPGPAALSQAQSTPPVASDGVDTHEGDQAPKNVVLVRGVQKDITLNDVSKSTRQSNKKQRIE